MAHGSIDERTNSMETQKYHITPKPSLASTMIAGLSLIIASYSGCIPNNNGIKPATPTTNQKAGYSIDEIKEVLGYRWQDMPCEQRQIARATWNTLSGDDKKMLADIYKNPQQYLSNLSPGFQEMFKQFRTAGANPTNLKGYEQNFPWLEKNDTLADQLALFELDVKESLFGPGGRR